MRFPVPLLAMALIGAGAAPALAQPSAGGEPAKPVMQRDPSAVDVVATPVTDLNLRKGEIPAILLAAEADPYSLRGLGRCPAISAEVRRFDEVLGDDIDIAQAPNRKVSAGKVAQSVVGSFIPFRGVIRELSGASEQERRVQAAFYAGTARRSFLKGVGLQRGCGWPARPATGQMLSQIADQNAAQAAAKTPARPRKPRR